MQTITAKELRDNLGKIVERVQRGETIQVTYRSKPAFTLNNKLGHTKTLKPGTSLATREFLRKAKLLRSKADLRTQLEAGKSYKEIYYQDMAKKYGFEK